MSERDFAPLLEPKRVPVLMWSCLVIVIVTLSTTLIVGKKAMQLSERETLAAGQLATLKAKRKSFSNIKPDKREAQLRKLYDEIQEEINFPWLRLLQNLERSSIDTVELQEFIPDRPARTITLSGLARSSEALAEYVDIFSSQPGLNAVHVTGQKVIERNGLKVIRFQIKASLLTN